MSEIIQVAATSPTIPFGKYHGRSAADVLARDPQYVEWILAQPWIHDRSPQLVQFFMNAGGEPSETPEHNALQAKFTQDAYCMAVAAMFSAGQAIRTEPAVLAEATGMVWPGAVDAIRTTGPVVTDRVFELGSWDVQYTFTGAGASCGRVVEPDCVCTPLDDSPLINANRTAPGFLPESVWDWSSLTWEMYLPKAVGHYRSATQHEPACPRSTIGYLIKHAIREDSLVDSSTNSFGIELKPIMGDDYPAVLRQVHGYKSRSRDRAAIDLAAVVVGEYRSSAVPWAIVKQKFWESQVLLISEAELDALVAVHAAEWGAALAEQSTFNVEFTRRL